MALNISFRPKCIKCQEYSKIRDSPSCVAYRLGRQTIFAYSGKLIYYVNNQANYCATCCNACYDCVYVKDGNYLTLFENSTLTIVDCEITRTLNPVNSVIIESDKGTFISPTYRTHNESKLLFLRGIKIKYSLQQDYQIFYPEYRGEPILQNIAFASLIDDNDNVYLIDKNGNALIYETLLFIDSEIVNKPPNCKIYANDQLRVKICGYYEYAEILADSAPVGNHTKMALHTFD